MTALVFAITALGACNVQFGADDDVVNPQVVNACDAPIEATLLRSDGTALGSRSEIRVGGNPHISAGLGAFDGVATYMVEIGVDGSRIWLSDEIPLKDGRPTFEVSGTCTPVSTCELVGVGELSCVDGGGE